MINRVVFGGVVERPSYGQAASSYYMFGIVQEESGTRRDGTPYTRRNRQRVKVFGPAADRAREELPEGARAIVCGKLCDDSRKGEDGTYTHDKSILADQWEVCAPSMPQVPPQAQQMSFGAPPQAQRGVAYAPPAPTYVQGTLPRPDLPPIQPLRAQPPQADVDDTPF